jgi:hypothetical protein
MNKTLLLPAHKRKVNKAFNSFIEPRRSDIDCVDSERRARTQPWTPKR